MSDTKFNSIDRYISLSITNGTVREKTTGTGLNVPSTTSRALTTQASSGAKNVSLAIKPSVLAQEQRQERLNQTIRKGYTPISRSTKG